MKYKSVSIAILTIVALLCCSIGYSQSKKRTKTETFSVNKDVTLQINTSHADVEFDTWNKNKVVIEATIEVVDATEEEMTEYFENWDFKAIGNSEKITISSRGNSVFLAGNTKLAIPYPEIDSLNLHMNLDLPIVVEIPEIATVPELPPTVLQSIDSIKFDYEAFEKDGEVYLKKWQKKWAKDFDQEKFRKGMEEWQKAFAKNQEKMQKVREKVAKVQKKYHEKHAAKIAVMQEKIHSRFDSGRVAIVRAPRLKGSVYALHPGSENSVYVIRNGKHLKIKKKIKIRMPKKAKLKLNVRHGEVTLAATSENIDAKLSHAALYANVIEGNKTVIESSYAPVHVSKWNNGALKVNFVDNVDLQYVNDINLMSNSSNVILGTLGNKGIVSGTFGNLLIHHMEDSFQTLDIILENTDARIQLPESAFRLYYIGSNSSITYPENVNGNRTKTQYNTIVRGYQKANTSDKEININAKYSEVSLTKKS